MIIKAFRDENCAHFLKQGDTASLEYLIRIYFPVLCRYSEKITNSQSDSEEITEDAFVKLWQRRSSFDSFTDIKRFLYTAIRNASLNKLRDKKRENARKVEFINDSVNEPDSDEADLIEVELLAEIRKSIDVLPPKMREIFILSYYKKMSNQEISEHLKLSEQTIRNQKTKALAKLKLSLSNKAFILLLTVFTHY